MTPNQRYYAKHRARILRRRRELYKTNDRLGYNNRWNAANRKRANATRKAWTTRNRLKSLLSHARKRARNKNLRFNITLADIVWPTHCPVFGFRLSKKIRKGDPRSPSLDRIIPCKGYVRGNVAVISLRANLLKNNATPTELKALAKWTARVTSK